MQDVKIKAPYKLELAKEGDAGYDIRNIGLSVKILPGQSAIIDLDTQKNLVWILIR